jgi:hypothetical protein
LSGGQACLIETVQHAGLALVLGAQLQRIVAVEFADQMG